MQRDDDGQVKGHFLVVVGDQAALLPGSGASVMALTVPVLNSVIRPMPFLASRPESSRLATGLVNAPSRGVT